MADQTIDLNRHLCNVGAEGDRDLLREMAEMVLRRLLIDAELSEQIGTERYERSETRVAHRDRCRDRNRETPLTDRRVGAQGCGKVSIRRICEPPAERPAAPSPLRVAPIR
jgi:hypothetical protein